VTRRQRRGVGKRCLGHEGLIYVIVDGMEWRHSHLVPRGELEAIFSMIELPQRIGGFAAE